jgi:hypothetical protein
MMKIPDCRIGNIQFRTSKTLLGKEYFEIVKYYPNKQYKKESEYNFDEESNRFWKYIEDTNIKVYYSTSCFVYPEACYTLATFEDDEGEINKYELKYCGDRPLELDEEEFEIFNEIVRWAYNRFKNNKDNDEE